MIELANRQKNTKIIALTLVALLSCIFLFHILILLGVIPYTIVWGGRLESAAQMYLFETVSLMINLLAIITVGTKAGYKETFLPKKIVNFLLWVFAVLFAINTVGNLFAESKLEMLLFTPLTFILSIFFYKLAMSR